MKHGKSRIISLILALKCYIFFHRNNKKYGKSSKLPKHLQSSLIIPCTSLSVFCCIIWEHFNFGCKEGLVTPSLNKEYSELLRSNLGKDYFSERAYTSPFLVISEESSLLFSLQYIQSLESLQFS